MLLPRSPNLKRKLQRQGRTDYKINLLQSAASTGSSSARMPMLMIMHLLSSIESPDWTSYQPPPICHSAGASSTLAPCCQCRGHKHYQHFQDRLCVLGSQKLNPLQHLAVCLPSFEAQKGAVPACGLLANPVLLRPRDLTRPKSFFVHETFLLGLLTQPRPLLSLSLSPQLQADQF